MILGSVRIHFFSALMSRPYGGGDALVPLSVQFSHFCGPCGQFNHQHGSQVPATSQTRKGRVPIKLTDQSGAELNIVELAGGIITSEEEPIQVVPAPSAEKDNSQIMSALDGNSGEQDEASRRAEESSSVSMCCQRRIMKALGQQFPLREGDVWYLIDSNWYRCWKQYVQYDHASYTIVGRPEEIDNSRIIDEATGHIPNHLIVHRDFEIIAGVVWNQLKSWCVSLLWRT